MRYYREHEEKKVYTIKDIDNYQDGRLSDNQAKKLVEHCNNYKIYPCICAWYDDMDDFYV